MEKLQSSFKNMVLSLVIIAVVAAGALAGVYLLTLETINNQKAAKQQAAILAVLPEGVEIGEAEEVNGLTVYKAYMDGEFAGAAVETQADGFGGPQKIMVGFDAEGKIINYEVLEHQETPGLGDHIVEWFKNADKPGQNIIGRQADGAFSVSKDGGDVDAITAATISSRAFLNAINKAFVAFKNGEVEAATGASQLHHQEAEAVEPEVEKQPQVAEEEPQVVEEEAQETQKPQVVRRARKQPKEVQEPKAEEPQEPKVNELVETEADYE
ncbi:MAG: RnfABCDGE type electron transport complex subunit G [Paludibacteraceae bacterium]|nr:RnfABCDGE type electron transport complex subunit G [Paludibacteraceae bacterium]